MLAESQLVSIHRLAPLVVFSAMTFLNKQSIGIEEAINVFSMKATSRLLVSNDISPSFESELWYRHNEFTSTALVLAYGLVFIIGLIGNILVIITVARGGRLVCHHSVTDIFLANLAVADLLVIIACLPFTLVSHLINRKYIHHTLNWSSDTMQSPHHLYINISMGAWHNYLQTVAVSPRRLCLLICLLAGGRCCRTMQNCHCPTQSANDHSNVSHYHRPHLDCCCSHHITLARRFQTISAAFIR